MNWESGKNYSIQVVYFIQELFYDEAVLTDESSYNPSIAHMAKENYEGFLTVIKNDNEENLKTRFDKTEKTSIVFSNFDENHQLIKNKILSQDNDIDTFDRIEDFKNWFTNNFSEQILKKDAKKQ